MSTCYNAQPPSLAIVMTFSLYKTVFLSIKQYFPISLALNLWPSPSCFLFLQMFPLLSITHKGKWWELEAETGQAVLGTGTLIVVRSQKCPLLCPSMSWVWFLITFLLPPRSSMCSSPDDTTINHVCIFWQLWLVKWGLWTRVFITLFFIMAFSNTQK